MEDKTDRRNGAAGKDVSGIRSVSIENVTYISNQFKMKASKVVGALTRQSPDKVSFNLLHAHESCKNAHSFTCS